MRLAIAGVLTKRQARLAKIRQNLLPRRLIQRPNHIVMPKRWHAGQTGQSRTTKHPEQDSLRLVVCRMAHGNAIGPTLLSKLLHHPIAVVTGHSLQGCPAPTGL
jgi:hypothetical protein